MTALVTGAGSGIGQAAARALSAAGARVVVTELPDRLERAEATVADLTAAGGEAVALPLDVRDLDSISECVAAAARIGDGTAGHPRQQRGDQRPASRPSTSPRRPGTWCWTRI